MARDVGREIYIFKNQQEFEKFYSEVDEVRTKHLSSAVAAAVDDGHTPAVVVQAILSTAYGMTKLSMKDENEDLGWVFRKLAERTVEYYEEQQ